MQGKRKKINEEREGNGTEEWRRRKLENGSGE